MKRGETSSVDLVDRYVARIEAIDRRGPRLRSVLELDPDARIIAAQLDEERRTRGVRGPLHGIPVLVKDNIDTAGRMQTTAGSLALAAAPGPPTREVVARLGRAGAVVLGKTNLSEWANIRSRARRAAGARAADSRKTLTRSIGTPVARARAPAPPIAANLAPRCARHRDRRLDREPRVDLRHRRAQADGRPREPARHHPHRRTRRTRPAP